MQPLSRLSVLNIGLFLYLRQKNKYPKDGLTTFRHLCRISWLIWHNRRYHIPNQSESWNEDNILLRISIEKISRLFSVLYARWGAGVWNPWSSRDLYLLQIVQTDSGTQPACYSIGIGVLSLGVKRPEGEVTTHVILVTLYSYSHEADRESFTCYIA